MRRDPAQCRTAGRAVTWKRAGSSAQAKAPPAAPSTALPAVPAVDPPAAWPRLRPRPAIPPTSIRQIRPAASRALNTSSRTPAASRVAVRTSMGVRTFSAHAWYQDFGRPGPAINGSRPSRPRPPPPPLPRPDAPDTWAGNTGRADRRPKSCSARSRLSHQRPPPLASHALARPSPSRIAPRSFMRRRVPSASARTGAGPRSRSPPNASRMRRRASRHARSSASRSTPTAAARVRSRVRPMAEP